MSRRKYDQVKLHTFNSDQPYVRLFEVKQDIVVSYGLSGRKGVLSVPGILEPHRILEWVLGALVEQ